MTMIQPFNAITGKPAAAGRIAVTFRDGIRNAP
jgi:hypothetical protein